MSVKSVAKNIEHVTGSKPRSVPPEIEMAYPYEAFASKILPHIRKYDAAMSELKVRFEIIDKDLQVRSHRNPIHHIESRTKSPRSMYEKIVRYGYNPTVENVEAHLMDVAGIRIITSYIQDVYRMVEMLKRQDDLEIVEIKDYIANPKPNGYRSLHVIVHIPVFFMDSKQMIPVEVQIRTIAMDFWASLEHDIRYKADRSRLPAGINEEMLACAGKIAEIDRQMQDMYQRIKAAEAAPDAAPAETITNQ